MKPRTLLRPLSARKWSAQKWSEWNWPARFSRYSRTVRQRALTSLWLCLGLTLPALFPAQGGTRELENEISGFVLDQTITRLGHDFSAYLSQYRNANSLGDYNLAIYERPSARWGNYIWVEHNRTRVFSMFMSPSRTNVQAVAEQAARQIHNEILRQELFYRLNVDADLAGDEF